MVQLFLFSFPSLASSFEKTLLAQVTGNQWLVLKVQHSHFKLVSEKSQIHMIFFLSYSKQQLTEIETETASFKNKNS